MAKPEWGIKRQCQNCNTKFYDLKRSPILCPKCGTVYDFESILKSRRSRPSTTDYSDDPLNISKFGAANESEEFLEQDIDVADSDAGDDVLLEDASDLGEDVEDMAEVIEHVEEEEN